jgi:hypothetical protein
MHKMSAELHLEPACNVIYICICVRMYSVLTLCIVSVKKVQYKLLHLFSHTYVAVSKSSRISSAARQQMAAQGCARSYSDLQS